MAAELHPVAMARPLFILKKERPRGEVLERERATVERERNGGEVGLAGVVSDEAGRRRGKAEALGRSSSPWSTRRARRERIDGLGWIEGKQRLAVVGWIGSGGNEAGWWKDPEGDLVEWRRRLGGWDISPQI